MDISLFFDTVKEYASRNINEFFAFLAGMSLTAVLWFLIWLRRRSSQTAAAGATKETIGALRDKYEAEKETLRAAHENRTWTALRAVLGCGSRSGSARRTEIESGC